MNVSSLHSSSFGEILIPKFYIRNRSFSLSWHLGANPRRRLDSVYSSPRNTPPSLLFSSFHSSCGIHFNRRDRTNSLIQSNTTSYIINESTKTSGQYLCPRGFFVSSLHLEKPPYSFSTVLAYVSNSVLV